MDNQSIGKEKYDINKLRGWQRSQLKILKEFVLRDIVPQTILSGASGYRTGSHAIGGSITPLTRANLIQKAGRDDKGDMTWQLNEDKVDRKTLGDLLDEIKV
ncbi:MAG: hypothetical protein ACOYUB_04645 [Patescibacteria group bacterium]